MPVLAAPRIQRIQRLPAQISACTARARRMPFNPKSPVRIVCMWMRLADRNAPGSSTSKGEPRKEATPVVGLHGTGHMRTSDAAQRIGEARDSAGIWDGSRGAGRDSCSARSQGAARRQRIRRLALRLRTTGCQLVLQARVMRILTLPVAWPLPAAASRYTLPAPHDPLAEASH